MSFVPGSGHYGPSLDDADGRLPMILPPGLSGQPRFLASEALAGGVGQTADLPGPSQGFVRLYDTIQAVSNTLGTGLTSVVVTITPGGQVWQTAQTGTSTIAGSNVTPIGYGETLRFTNGGAGAGRVQGSYVDIPAYGIGLIRAVLDAVGVEVIPAPPAGYIHRFLLPFPGSSSTSGAPGVRVHNADAVAHSIETLHGGVLVGRSVPVNAAAFGSIAGPFMASFTAAVTMRTTEAINTTGPHIIWAYEAIPAISGA